MAEATQRALPASPRIKQLVWGRLETDDGHIYADAKLYPGGSASWDWHMSGTDHVQGIQVQDIQELVEAGAKVIVMGKGIYGRLRVAGRIIHMLEQQGIKTHALPTSQAVALYNELAASEPVGGIFHSTC